jgi:hypothetical protein
MISHRFGIFSTGCDEGMVMRMRKAFRFLFLLVILVLSVSAIRSVASAQIVLNELMADPASDYDGDGVYSYRDDEWVEITNLGGSSVDLSGFYLSDAEGPPIWRYGFAGQLEPGEVIIVYGSDSRAWEESAGFPIYGLSLNNTGDELCLYRVTGEDTILVDAYAFGDKAADDDRSVGRRPYMPDLWIMFDGLNPCSDPCEPPSSGCNPTPGQPNDCAAESGSESWGAIKNRYSG